MCREICTARGPPTKRHPAASQHSQNFYEELRKPRTIKKIPGFLASLWFCFPCALAALRCLRSSCLETRHHRPVVGGSSPIRHGQDIAFRRQPVRPQRLADEQIVYALVAVTLRPVVCPSCSLRCLT